MKAPSPEFAALWLAWAAGFAAIEYAAFRRRRTNDHADGDTLTEFVRWIGSHRVGRVPVGRLGVLVSCLLLTGHLALGWP